MYKRYVEQMNKAKGAKERKTVIEEMCRMFAFSQAKAYKVLKENGWESGRKKRIDAGTSSLTEEALRQVGSLLRNGLRKNGKATMSVPTARAILKSNGFDIPIGESQLRYLLAKSNLSVDNARVPTPHRKMRTLYPNHVHQADPSMALIWFAPDGSQKVYDADELYKNKNPREGKMKCWRYVLTDHASGSICVRYYAAMGESAENMYDFLLYAWGIKSNPLYVFHGLPELLVWDCGTANTAKAVTTALTALNVETKPHMPGNPRAKGQVEVSNNIVETQFESRLKLEPVHSIEQLNDAAERWCAGFNANMIDHTDTRITRGGKKIASRVQLWQKISEDQLRELPDPEVCRQIFTTGIQTRKVAGDLSVSIVHPKLKFSARYSLHGLQGILVGQTVNVQPILVSDKAKAWVSYEHGKEVVRCEIEPIDYYELGFDVSAPVVGLDYKAAGFTDRERTAQALAELSESKTDRPFTKITDGKGLAAHSFIDAKTPFITQSRGKQIDISTVEIHEILISAMEAAKRFKARTGYIPEGFINRIKTEYPEGMPTSMIDDLVHEYEGGAVALKQA